MYIAECIYKVYLDKGDEKYKNFVVMLYYKECAYAATCEPLDHRQGEKAFRSGFEVLVEDDLDAAEEFWMAYANRVRKVVSDWQPEEKTKELVQRYFLTLE
jgi:hypothetical protein